MQAAAVVMCRRLVQPPRHPGFEPGRRLAARQQTEQTVADEGQLLDVLPAVRAAVQMLHCPGPLAAREDAQSQLGADLPQLFAGHVITHGRLALETRAWTAAFP